MLIALLLSIAPAAWAGAREDYAQGLELAESARFEQAVAPLKRALQGSLSLGEQKKARLALAQSLFYSQKTSAARTELRIWCKQFSTELLDEALYPPDFVAFFKTTKDEVKRDAQRPVEPKPDPVRVAEPEPSRVEVKPEPVKVVEPKPAETAPANPTLQIAPEPPASAPWYLKIIPFGVGQFANGDKVGGGVWLGVELALLAANVSLAVYNNVNIRPDGGYPRSDASRALYISQDVSAGLLIGTCVFGIIDAFVWSPKRVAAGRVTATLSPTGAALIASF